jgi:hypothetical protein
MPDISTIASLYKSKLTLTIDSNLGKHNTTVTIEKVQKKFMKIAKGSTKVFLIKLLIGIKSKSKYKIM